MNKKDLRQHFSKLRNNINPITKQEWDNILSQKLIEACSEARVIHTYLPFRSEPNLTHFIKTMLSKNITVVCPKTLKNGVMQNRILDDIDNISYGLYNTPYPTNDKEYLGQYDMIIVPGLAFDLSGYRLGYGGGYYDRFLINHLESKLIVPCYPFQLVKEIPTDKYDIPVNDLILSL